MKAVLLAGGLGNRLKPLTDTVPKPLLPIGEKSILEIQINRLSQQEFKEIFVATYYKADYVESFIGNGYRHGVKITFSKEETPLGTCGPLSLLKDQLNEPFILMNGDILTTINFQFLYRFGMKQESDLTVVTKKIRTPFNFGSVVTQEDRIIDIEEKPDLELEILAGIYFMKPAIMDHIPDRTYFGIDDLIKTMLTQSQNVSRYLMKEYWLDIGSMDSYHEAQEAYEEHFKESS